MKPQQTDLTLPVDAESRRRIFAEFTAGPGRKFSGELTEVEFLGRLYDLTKLPSEDPRYENALGDIQQHRVRNDDDWAPDWLLGDSRFLLGSGPVEAFWAFLLETLHPAVRPSAQAATLLASFNNQLVRAGVRIERIEDVYQVTKHELRDWDFETGFPIDLVGLLDALAEDLELNAVLAVLDKAGLSLRSIYDNWNGGTHRWRMDVHLPVSEFRSMTEEWRSQWCERVQLALTPYFAEFENDTLGPVALYPRVVAGAPIQRRSRYNRVGTELGSGGYAKVEVVVDPATNQRFALKTLRNPSDAESKARFRREIQEQFRMRDRYVMPVLDFDREQFKWLVMPIADGDLWTLRDKLADDELVRIVRHVAAGLRAAHGLGLVHRDISPGNILRISEGDDVRWVVGDWGLVRRARGQTSRARTAKDKPLGTQGFAAPELWHDAHASASPASDIYSVGRVVGWFTTRKIPQPNKPLAPPRGPWRTFVECTTSELPEERQTNIDALLEEANLVGIGFDTALLVRAQYLIGSSDLGAVHELADLCVGARNHASLFIDVVSTVGEDKCANMVALKPEASRVMLDAMSDHLLASEEWKGRDFNESAPPLLWVLRMAQGAEACGQLSVLESACLALFEGDAKWRRFVARRDAREWICQVRGAGAEVIARSLRRIPRVVQWYVAEGWTPASDTAPVILDALRPSRA
ncbi:MAG: serine/threonine protein kinase [Polyangiaceae bacterium]|nr:serine/threonine protein kinase [Polyangiaceae bacterium]